MCHPGAMDAPPVLQTRTHYPSKHLRLPDTFPPGWPLIRPLMRHHGPETHPHGHNSSSSEQWVCPDHERDDPDQTLRRPSRASNQSGSRCNCNCLLTKHELEEPVVQQLQDLDKVSRLQVRLGSLLIRPRRPSRISDDHKWLHSLWLCAIPPMAMAM